MMDSQLSIVSEHGECEEQEQEEQEEREQLINCENLLDENCLRIPPIGTIGSQNNSRLYKEDDRLPVVKLCRLEDIHDGFDLSKVKLECKSQVKDELEDTICFKEEFDSSTEIEESENWALKSEFAKGIKIEPDLSKVEDELEDNICFKEEFDSSTEIDIDDSEYWALKSEFAKDIKIEPDVLKSGTVLGSELSKRSFPESANLSFEISSDQEPVNSQGHCNGRLDEEESAAGFAVSSKINGSPYRETGSHLLKHGKGGNTKKPKKGKQCQTNKSPNTTGTIKECKIRRQKKLGKFICDSCEYQSPDKWHLIHHLRTHTGEKPYNCKICSYRSASASTLKTHKRMHTGKKPFCCTICNFRSTQFNSLKEHERTHTGEKPYRCTICDYSSSYSSSLLRHKRIHTGEKPYCCSIPLCNYRSSDSSHLIRHVRAHEARVQKRVGKKNIEERRKEKSWGEIQRKSLERELHQRQEEA